MFFKTTVYKSHSGEMFETATRAEHHNSIALLNELIKRKKLPSDNLETVILDMVDDPKFWILVLQRIQDARRNARHHDSDNAPKNS